MKKLIPAALLGLAVAYPSWAQTVTDDFSTSVNWSSSSALFGTPSLEISSGVAKYTVSTPSSNDFAYISYTGAVGSVTQSWSVRVDVAFGSPASIFTTDTAQAIDLSLAVTKTGSTLGFDLSDNPTFNSFAIAGVLAQSAPGYYESWFRAGAINSAGTPEVNQFLEGDRLGAQAGSGLSAFTGAVQITFDHLTQTLSAGYDVDGPAGGYAFVSAGLEVDIDAAGTNWNMTTGDTFTVMLWGNSLFDDEVGEGDGPSIAPGLATFDNLELTNVSAIPEPSSFALFAGLGMIGLAVARRKR